MVSVLQRKTVVAVKYNKLIKYNVRLFYTIEEEYCLIFY